MRLLIHADCLDDQKAGIHTYTKEIIAHLNLTSNDGVLRLQKDPNLTSTNQIICPFKPLKFYKTYRLLRLLPKIINDLNPKLFWEPSHIMPMGLNKKIKKVLTIHDLSSITLPQYHTKMNVLGHKLFLKQSIKNADTILTVSNSVKEEIIDRYKPKANVISIYNGIVQPKEVATNLPLPLEKYFIYLGTLEPRKNIELLIKSFLQIKNKIPQKLFIVGGTGWKSESIRLLISQNSDSIKYLGFLPEPEKNFYLKNATAMIYPSFYEGFGLPIMEALNLGTPVITSNQGALKEIYQDYTIQFDPYSITDLSKILLQISQNPELTTPYQQQGITYSKQFTWEKTAYQINQIFQELIS